MKKNIIACIVFLNSYSILFSQNHEFKWIDNKNKMYSINPKTNELESVSRQGDHEKVVDLNIKSGTFSDLPLFFDINWFFIKNKILFTIQGTGQVYQLDLTQRSFDRIDKTFYRGYNFYANQFIKNDTIFSIGGQGFWQKHSLITYYNAKSKEWDLLKINRMNNRPSDFKFSGYSKKNDIFFSAFFEQDSIINKQKVKFQLFDFKTRNWSDEGDLTDELAMFFTKEWRSIWTGEYLFCFKDDTNNNLRIIDPFRNEVLVPKEWTDKFFLPNSQVYYNNGWLYSHQLNNTVVGSRYILDSINVKDLVTKSDSIGKLYDPTITKSFFWIYFIFISIAGFILFYFVKNKLNNKIVSSDNLVQLNELEIKLLNEFLFLPKGASLSSQQLNLVLDLNDKSYDNQRQIRNRIITSINNKLSSTLNLAEVIIRNSSGDDKRIMNYSLNNDLDLSSLSILLKNINSK
jgi:hypothetical protein